ncbi:hypothetical protein K438DRAFT_1821110 [Mycena galopus ATCC 62051]|nr:hypothetical protein K438DRAFT_1821110 [Mycena galopus ATCC 62051]
MSSKDFNVISDDSDIEILHAPPTANTRMSSKDLTVIRVDSDSDIEMLDAPSTAPDIQIRDGPPAGADLQLLRTAPPRTPNQKRADDIAAVFKKRYPLVYPPVDDLPYLERFEYFAQYLQDEPAVPGDATKAALESIKRLANIKKNNEGKNWNEILECPICLDTDKRPSLLLTCGCTAYGYHLKCLPNWAAQSNSQSGLVQCSTCRLWGKPFAMEWAFGLNKEEKKAKNKARTKRKRVQDMEARR